MALLGVGTAAAFAAMLLAGIAAAAVTGLSTWCGPVDRPRERGLHDRPTPTAGGLGLIAGVAVGLIAFSILGPGWSARGRAIAAAFGFAAALGLIGAWDDLHDLGARTKLLIQAGMAAAFAMLAARIEAIPLTATLSLPLGAVVGVLGTTLWIVVVVNAANFIDGADGLAPGVMIVAFVGLALSALHGGDAGLAATAGIAAAAGVGFLPWNFPRARVFQGDAGALFSSFLLAALAVIGAGPSGRGTVGLFFAPLALLPMLADVLLTLLARTRARKPLFEAHREHLYQRWLARRGGDHAALAWRAMLVTALFTGGALTAARGGAAVQLAAMILGAAVAVAAWRSLSRRTE